MIQPAPGVLLIAEPFMPDPNFARTVVLLVEHNMHGSFGVILNRPAPVQVREVTEFFGDIEHGLYLGGPVETKVLHVLHALPPLESHSQKVMDNLYWTADMRAIRGVLAARHIPDTMLRFYAGYAGWAPGQLDREIAFNSWILAPARREYVFATDVGNLWKRVLTDMGGKYAFIATFPPDPRLN
ncbi:MAG: YqgE/AlgH family protein [Bacteroidia bacterium]|nr:YqgE/AlgH family protein [Bacteroidia bacterium]MDW8015991.1 YqgE/AlgH family protein [Bacteroidia bacterium]